MSVTGFIVDGQIQKYDYNSLDNLPDIPESSGTFWATYNVTTETEITNAFSDNKNVMMKFGNDVFLVTRKLGIGPSGSAWLFTSVGQTNIRTTWVSGSYWNTFSTNAIDGDISNNLKQALLQIASKIAYIDEYGQTYYNDLYNALYPHELMSISATFNQGSNIIYDIYPLTVLNQYLTVVANYSDGTTETISSSNYTLSGNLLEGVSTITVYYEGFTDTFDVNVTHMAGYYTIVNNLTECTTNNSATAIQENTSYTATITASVGYTLSGATVTITMGGNILTGVFSNGTISIPNVTGDLVITVVASAVTVSSIAAVYTQSGKVYTTDSLDSLKTDLVVTAYYSDSTTAIVTSYTLSGTLTEGTSTIIVSFGGKTTTFNVVVSASNILYRLPQATTFNGTSDYVDTELKLNKTDIDYTILGHFYIDSSVNSYNTVMHCMHEARPWPGSLIDYPAKGLRFGFGDKNIQSELAISGYPKEVKFAITHQQGSGVYNVETLNNDNRKTASATWTFATVSENLILGAYQTTGGAKERYLKGTIYDFCVYDEILSSSQIDSYFAS